MNISKENLEDILPKLYLKNDFLKKIKKYLVSENDDIYYPMKILKLLSIKYVKHYENSDFIQSFHEIIHSDDSPENKIYHINKLLKKFNNYDLIKELIYIFDF